MKLRWFIAGMILITLLSWASLLSIVFYYNPDNIGNNYIFILFYLSLFFGLTGFFSLIIFSFKKFFNFSEPFFKQVATSFRQGFLLSLSLVLALFFQAHNLLQWWNCAFLIILIVIIELFLARRVKKL